MKSIISINSLSKTFKSGFKALENVSLDINKGEIFALLGPNGAGKTTLISIITGITIPTSGSVKVNNYDVIKDPIKTRSIIPGITPAANVLETGTYVRALNKIAAFEGGIKASSNAADAAKTTTKGVG